MEKGIAFFFYERRTSYTLFHSGNLPDEVNGTSTTVAVLSDKVHSLLRKPVLCPTT